MIRITLCLMLLLPLTAVAQHEHHHPPAQQETPRSSDAPTPSAPVSRCEGGYCHTMKEPAIFMGQLTTTSWSTDAQYFASLDGFFWYGTSLRRVWVRLETENLMAQDPWPNTEILYSKATGAYWDVQVGLKMIMHSRDREVLAGVGISGLAPYWFDVHGGIWLGRDGHVLGRMEAAYEYPLSQRIHVVPKIEAEIDNEGVTTAPPNVSTWTLSISPTIGLHWEWRREVALGLVYTAPGLTSHVTDTAPVQVSLRLWY